LTVGVRSSFEVEVGGAAVAVGVDLVARLEAGEALAAGVAAKADAVGVDVRAGSPAKIL
jgi:hypothetical protein